MLSRQNPGKAPWDASSCQLNISLFSVPIKLEKAQLQKNKTELTVTISSASFQELLNEVKDLKQEVFEMKNMISTLSFEKFSSEDVNTNFSLKMSK